MNGTQDLPVPSLQRPVNLKLLQNRKFFKKLENCHIALQAKCAYFPPCFLMLRAYHHEASLVYPNFGIAQ